jgi:hypothetical protein
MRKYIKILIIILITCNTTTAQKESNWKGEIDFGGGFTLTTFLNIKVNQNTVIITSPENADRRLFGWFKSFFGRMTGKLPSDGIFMTINSSINGEELDGEADIIMLGNFKFKGQLKKDVLTGTFIKDSKEIGSLNFFKNEETEMNFEYLYPHIVNTTKSNIYSQNVFNDNKWKVFEKDLKETLSKARDDIELFIGFSVISQDLPFSHYRLFFSKESEESNSLEDDDTEVSNSVDFEEKSPTIAYLKIKNFSTSQKELSEILPGITGNSDYQNLIVDLRDNGGGGIEAAFELADHLINRSVNIGYFVTNKLAYTGFEKVKFESLPEITPKTTDEFVEYCKSNRGAKLIFQASNKNKFKGKIYVLINHNTGSTCEPIVYILKKELDAILIGETSAGAMLSAAQFDVYDKYKLFLPIADYYTTEGNRIDQIGISPDIEIDQELALEKAMEIINNNNQKNH